MNVQESYDQELDSFLEYKRALNACQEQLKHCKEEKDALQEVHEDFKIHYERLKKECERTKKQLLQTISENKQMEEEYDAQIDQFRRLLDEREKVLEEQRNRAMIPTDANMIRAKIIREIEVPHKQKIDELTQDINKLEAESEELRRTNALLKSEIETTNNDYTRQIDSMKQKYQSQIDALHSELEVLRDQADDPNDRELARVKSREADEYKRKLADAKREIGELRKQRDELKLENNSNTINHLKEVEEYKIGKKKTEQEIYDQHYEIERLEEELKREVKLGNERQEQIQQLIDGNDSLQKKLQECELELNDYREQYRLAEIRRREQSESLEEYGNRIEEEKNSNDFLKNKEVVELRDNLNKVREALEKSEQARRNEAKAFSSQLDDLEHDKKLLRSKSSF